MAFNTNHVLSEFRQEMEPVLPDIELAPGICEVISVGPCDELPYVFEISGGQKLSFSLSASHEVDLVLCDESAYDEWVDGGLQSEHPGDCILALRHARQHSLEYRPDQDTTLIAIIINLGGNPVQAVVAAHVPGCAC
ncbi:MAG: hypothetical protein K1X67_20705 [Fimbriimonadaceae bacterium]|jgi:hypothetical protein|nr:hypothetical protein [Fimbriimonadaceae bacterium]